MKIKIALISSEHSSKAQELSVKLHKAMEAGEMDTVDFLTFELISLTDPEYSLSLIEEYWHQLLEKIRSFDGDFKSDFIMDKPQLKIIIAADVADSFADVSAIVMQALKTDGVLLQLPFEEENTDV